MMTRYVPVGLTVLAILKPLFAQFLKVIPLPYSTPVKVCDFEMPFMPTDTATSSDFDGRTAAASLCIDLQNKNLLRSFQQTC